MYVPRGSVLAFDLDGTLLDHRPGVELDYESQESLAAAVVPHEPACRLVRVLNRRSPVAYITGRSWVVYDVTRRHLEAAGLPHGALIMQAGWGGYEELRAFKARALKCIGARLFVGDHEADELAARDTGTPFMHVDHFRALAALEMKGATA